MTGIHLLQDGLQLPASLSCTHLMVGGIGTFTSLADLPLQRNGSAPAAIDIYTQGKEEGWTREIGIGDTAMAYKRALLLEVLNGRMTNNEALGYYGSMDIFCLGPVI